MKKKLKYLFLSLLLLLILFIGYLFIPFPTPHIETRYEVIDLGTLPGENQSMAFDINNHGQVVGSSGGFAFLWDSEGRMEKVAEQFWNCGINDKGEVLGAMVISDATGITVDHLVLMDSSGKFEDLGLCMHDRSFDFNLEGKIVWADFKRQKGFHSFVRNASGEISEIDLPGYTHEQVKAINEEGVIMGVAKDANRVVHTFLLDEQSHVQWINPDTTLKNHFWGEILNDEGWVAGGLSTTKDDFVLYLWDGESFSVLPTLGGRAFSTDMNNLNQIVGGSVTSRTKTKDSIVDGAQSLLGDIPHGDLFSDMMGLSKWQPDETRAVLWEEGEISDLNTLVPPDSDWNLIQANAINDKGEIVGWGYHGEGKHPKAFLLRPIEKE